MDEIYSLLAQQSARPQAVIEQPAQAPAGPTPAMEQPSWLPMLGIFGLFAVFMFFMSRSQRKEEKRKKEMMAALKKGDQVVTSAGIIGTISSLKDDTIILNVGGVKVEFLASAISSLRAAGKGEKSEKE